MGNGLPLSKSWGEHPIWIAKVIDLFRNEKIKYDNEQAEKKMKENEDVPQGEQRLGARKTQ